MDPSTAEERPPFSSSFELADRLESPSSNERNTNTICSSSESDVMKTPSAGGDTPSAGGDSPGVFSPESAEGRPPPPLQPVLNGGAPSPPDAPLAAAPELTAPGGEGYPAVPAPVLAGLPAESALPPAVPPRLVSAADAITESPHRAATCDCLLCDATFHPRLGEGLRRRPGRGRARTTYHSQISPEANSIKLKITVEHGAGTRRKRGGARGRRRRRKGRLPEDDAGDDSEEEGAPAKRRRSQSLSQAADEAAADADRPQGPWGEHVPPELLLRIFGHVVSAGGAVPAALRLSRVCRLWRSVAVRPELWRTVDLATGLIRDKYRHQRVLTWLADNRLSKTEELNLAGWSAAVSSVTVPALVSGAPGLRWLCLSGCRALAAEDVTRLAELPQLSALDLSGVQPNSSTARSPVGPHALHELAERMGPRLVSLIIAHNCVAGMQQIVNAVADFCPNLEVLDLSNIMNAIRDIVPVKLERLQAGCPKLRILRWTNTEIKLADAPLKDQMSSQGFPELEELSVAVPKGRHWGLDDAGVERVLKSSHKLRLLDVRGCTRLSDSSLVRVPAWNLQHLFLSGCEATRTLADRLELIVRKWRHSLLELDLSWATNQAALDAALLALAEADGDQPAPLSKLDLTGAAGTFPPVCRLVERCPALAELNLTSCRALPRGVKRHYRGAELDRLRADIADGKYRDKGGQTGDG